MASVHFILYVREQSTSTSFYRRVLGREPSLDVPGMTEFAFGEMVLGLMPVAGIRRLLGDGLFEGAANSSTPRAELYLVVDDPQLHHRLAIEAGARELSALAPRDWGHSVAYSLDLDGYVLAFAKPDAENSRPQL